LPDGGCSASTDGGGCDAPTGNCYANAGEGVTEDVVLGAARAMADKLKHAGYEYINLDW
jgi:hypothetical protein